MVNHLHEETPLSSTTSPPTAAAIAAQHGLRLVDLAAERLETLAFAMVPPRVIEGSLVLPYRFEGGRLVVAVADPSDIGTIDHVRLSVDAPVELVVAPAVQIRQSLRRLTTQIARAAVRELEADGQPEAPRIAMDDDAPAVRLVNDLTLQAAEAGASDVHLVPLRGALLVRVRIDGVVRDVRRIVASEAPAVLARLKVLAKLDISEQRRPQDGRLSLQMPSGREVDVRVAILPTVDGEGAVLRLLDKSKSAPTLTELGLSNPMQMDLERILQRATGALLVTGPTGSGKSTTLHASLTDVMRPDINVITIEDPVEYRLPGAYQVQVNPRVGVTFDVALRSILRSDPDVVVVGEIRDAETAALAIEAALTGHFVFSTMHTTDAPSAVTRLTEMGVEPYLTSAGVTGVLAQRLVRRLCLTCRERYEPTELELERLGLADPPADLELYAARGCDACEGGYRGRVGVFQLMTLSEPLRGLVAARATRAELDAAATAEGMGSLWADGVEKALRGVTTVDELRRSVR